MIKILCFLFALVAAPLVHAEGEVLGKWNTEKSEEGAWLTVDIQPCGDKLCGTIVDAHEVKDASIVGTEMIKGMQQKTETAFAKGKIYAPDTKKWYKSKMKLKDTDTLKVSGCVLGGVICRSQTWTRAK
jgi:uncharacterized protein (DUF2147 family)